MALRSTTACKVFFLYESDFQSAINNFNSDKRKHALVLLNQVSILKEWNMIRKTAFGESMTTLRKEAGEVIYNTGDPVTSVFFIRAGLVQLEVFYEVQHITTVPVRKDLYERRTTLHLIKKVIKIVKTAQLFGIEEIIGLRHIRMIRAKALKPTLLFVADKRQVLMHLQRKDVRQFIDQCKAYTDFDHQGVELGHHIK